MNFEKIPYFSLRKLLQLTVSMKKKPMENSFFNDSII